MYCNYYCLAAKQKRKKFTEAEEVKFRCRLEEGFDITTDQRYNQWLEVNKSTQSADLYDDSLNFTDYDSFDELLANNEDGTSEAECK